MAKIDTKLIAPVDLLAAVGLLTRLPVRVDGDAAMARGAASAWAYPLAGVLLGLIGAVTASGLSWFGVPPQINAAIVLGLAIMLSGAMHEDGLADTADGLWGGWDKERRLEIMKDSRVGVYGVCALGVVLLARWAALGIVIAAGAQWAALVAAGAISRAAMVGVMGSLPNARGNGLSHSVGQPSAQTVWLAIGLGAVVALLCGFLGAAVIVALAALAVRQVASAKIGGQTGDILGATQQIAEVAALTAIAAALG